MLAGIRIAAILSGASLLGITATDGLSLLGTTAADGPPLLGTTATDGPSIDDEGGGGLVTWWI